MKKNPRVIDMLRVLYPEDLWYYDPLGRRWLSMKGRITVIPCSPISQFEDGPTKTLYHISNTNELVSWAELWLRYQTVLFNNVLHKIQENP